MNPADDERKTCGRCGYKWSSITDAPVRCPSCGSYRWQGKPSSYTCMICGHSWFPRSDNVPLRCPSCKTRSWSVGKRASGTAYTSVDEETTHRIIELYGSGMGCLEISMRTETALATVIGVVKSRGGVDPRPRM